MLPFSWKFCKASKSKLLHVSFQDREERRKRAAHFGKHEHFVIQLALPIGVATASTIATSGKTFGVE
jgi:hypothetical protein